MPSGFTLVMLTQVSDTNEYAEQELMDHFLLNAMGQPRDPPMDKQDFVKVLTYIHTYVCTYVHGVLIEMQVLVGGGERGIIFPIL